jgi:amidophosphoribosyltransferase
LIGIRDANGFRPLNLGKLNDSYVLASETCAFDLIGATYLREDEPGEIVIIRGSELQSVKLPPAPKLSKCIFEHVYFSRPDSVVFGRTVQQSRDLLGRILARESPVDADLVVPIRTPASPQPSDMLRKATPFAGRFITITSGAPSPNQKRRFETLASGEAESHKTSLAENA